MQTWNLLDIQTPDGSRDPVVLNSTADARAVLVALNPGQELGDHQVKERAWLVVVDGEAEIRAGGDVIRGGRGTVACFEPDERHEVASAGGARLLLFLAPWPGEGHYRGEERSL
jgi:quercetin dioxygenase-like cupin family protein